MYDAARRRLSEQLGIEPGEPLRRLHTAILEGGGAEGDASGGVDLEGPRKRRFPAPVIALAGAALLAAAVAVAALAGHGSGSARIVRLHGDSVGLIQPASGHVVGQFNVGTVPSQVVADAHTAWTLNAAARTVSRIDLASGRVRTTGTVATPAALALGDGSLWVSSSIGVLRLDPTTLQQTAQVRLPKGTNAGALLVTAQGVWVGTFGGVDRIDPARDQVDLRIPVSDPRFGPSTIGPLAQLRGAIFGLTDDRSIVRIDPAARTFHLLIRLNLPV